MEYLTVSFLVRSGVRPYVIAYLSVLDGGRELEIKIKRPRPFYDTSKMHKNWFMELQSLLQ